MVVPPLVTETDALAVNPPSCVVTVIAAEPALTPVTTPEELTVATEVLLEDQVTDLLVALDGETVAVSVVEPPTETEVEVGETETPVADTVLLLVVIADVVVKLPSCVFTVIVAEPVPTPVTTPDELTAATEVLLEDQVTDLLVALDGETVAVSVVEPPTGTVAEVGETVTPVTETVVVDPPTPAPAMTIDLTLLPESSE